MKNQNEIKINFPIHDFSIRERERERINIAIILVESIFDEKDLLGKGIMMTLSFAREGLKAARNELEKDP